MAKGGFGFGVYTGLVVARSSEMPSTDITYTIEIQGPNGPVKFEGVRPQSGSRLTDFDPSANLVPFVVGQRVVVHVDGRGGSYSAIIGTAETPLGSFGLGLLVRITGSSSISPNRWAYEWEEVVRTVNLFNTPDPARTSDTDGLAYNTIEAGNSASGMQGNGVNTSNIPRGFAIVPIGSGAVVELSGFDGISWRFTAVNQLDGICEAAL